MAISPTSRTTDCTHCGEINDARRNSCNLCGSLLQAKSVSPAVAPPNVSLSEGMNGLSEEDRLALMGYAEIAQLSPVAASSQNGARNYTSPPQMDVNHRPFGLKAMQMSGVAAFAMGLFFCSGNLLGFFPTAPFVGYVSLLIGGALWHSSTHIND